MEQIWLLLIQGLYSGDRVWPLVMRTFEAITAKDDWL